MTAMKQRKSANPKRRLIAQQAIDAAKMAYLLETPTYAGNPERKRNPGDFGLRPPSQPRQGKSLCDMANLFARTEALRLLREGISKGLISSQERNGWTQNVWVVTAPGIPLKAMLENQDQGVYHGYPMLHGDP
jgi:hypothetical protein